MMATEPMLLAPNLGTSAPSPSWLPRVLFVVGSLEPGGAEKQLVALVRATHRRQIDASVAVFAHAADGRLAGELEAIGVPITSLRPAGKRGSGVAGVLTRMMALTRRAVPDLIYPWLEESAVVAAPVARVCGLPMLLARRNVTGPYALRLRPAVRMIHAAERSALIATVNSQAVAAETVRRGIPPNRIRVVRNGHPAVLPVPLPDSDVVTLGYLAHMRAEKGHMRFLNALSSLRTDVPWRARVGGDGPMADALRAEAVRAGLGSRVDFVGPVSEVRQFWAQCDAAVILSDHEGSPNALVEAATFGRPLVGTAVGGIPELVNARTGFLVDRSDEVATVAALRDIIENRPLRTRFGDAARELARRRFSMDQFVEGHCRAMTECLSLHAGRVQTEPPCPEPMGSTGLEPATSCL
jgi:glycosyltransferase involved in cell wall biosynthesis